MSTKKMVIMKVHEAISKNLDYFYTLVRAGVISSSYMNYYEIYRTFQGASGIKSKMDRYYYVANATKNNVDTVRRAIGVMERRA